MFRSHHPMARTTHDGHVVNWRTKAALLVAEDKLNYKLTLLQGSYSTAVAGSAGTHDGGGVIDLPANDVTRKLRALKNVGFAAFHRKYNWDGRGGSEHIHACLTGDKEMAPLAKLQCQGFLENRDGLGGWPFGVDNSYHPDPPVVFDYHEWQSERKFLSDLRRQLKVLFRQREKVNQDIDELRKRIKNQHH